MTSDPPKPPPNKSDSPETPSPISDASAYTIVEPSPAYLVPVSQRNLPRKDESASSDKKPTPPPILDCLFVSEDLSEHKTPARTKLLQISLANQLPLNRAAAQFLPPEWMDKWAELHVLSLMRWGLENGLEIVPKAPHHPDQDEVEARINDLAQMEPKKVMQFLTDPENTGDVVLNAEELLNQKTPEDAAGLLLETLTTAWW